MASELPPFQEASFCDVCKCTFNTFRRRHHCRRCGRTLCAEHSSNQMALPQFGIYSRVRVCVECYNNDSRPRGDNQQGTTSYISSVTDSISTLDISEADDMTTGKRTEQTVCTVECKCGMPLCICEVPPQPDKAINLQGPAFTSAVHSNPKPKKVSAAPKSKGSTSNNRSTIFNPGQVTNSSSENVLVDYEVNGEGLREAIKNSDATAAKKLLNQGVDANYCDKQGSSLLHLAAVFNQTEIAFALMERGANLNCKNSQGETPLDCAPATLQYKMKMKMEERRQSGGQDIIQA